MERRGTASKSQCSVYNVAPLGKMVTEAYQAHMHIATTHGPCHIIAHIETSNRNLNTSLRKKKNLALALANNYHGLVRGLHQMFFCPPAGCMGMTSSCVVVVVFFRHRCPTSVRRHPGPFPKPPRAHGTTNYGTRM